MSLIPSPNPFPPRTPQYDPRRRKIIYFTGNWEDLLKLRAAVKSPDLKVC